MSSLTFDYFIPKLNHVARNCRQYGGGLVVKSLIPIQRPRVRFPVAVLLPFVVVVGALSLRKLDDTQVPRSLLSGHLSICLFLMYSRNQKSVVFRLQMIDQTSCP